MTIEIIATSVDDARPVELYEFSYSGETWYYTSADTDIVFGGHTFIADPMVRAAIQEASDPTKASIDITVAGNSPVAELFRILPPSEKVSVTLYETNYMDETSFIVGFKGRILNCEWKSSAEAQFTTESIFSSAQRQGVRRRIQLGCPLVLYGDECGVNQSDWEEVSTAASIAGLTLLIPAAMGKIDNYYAGGKITWVNNVKGNIEKRHISKSSSTGTLIIATQAIGLVTSQEVKIYAGCSHALEDVNGCSPKFNNHIRYGGDPYIPPKGPFGGTAIF